MSSPAVIQARLMAGGFTDEYAAFVKSLLHFDGGVDDSATPATSWALGGGAVITADGAKILAGSGALDCSSSTGDRIAATSSAMNLGTGDFCIECWFYDPNIGTKNQGLWLLEGTATSQTVRVYGSASATITADASGGGPSAPEVAYSLSTWNHIAVTRSGSNWTLWLNGVSSKTWTNGTFNGGAASTNLWVGSASGLTSGRQCYIDEFRITVGVPRYTTTFTPTYPYPNP